MARIFLGTRLRERRLALGLKQAEAAAAAGVSPAYLNLIEHNRRVPTPAKLADLARALGLDPGELDADPSGPLVQDLRGVAAGFGAAVELDRTEDLAGRYPGWAALIVRQQERIEALSRTVSALDDRLSHDPHLSASLHEVLTAMASVRSTAGILAETPDLDADWRARFHANLHQDSERLAKGAETLVEWLDHAGGRADTGPVAPQEEVESWAQGCDWDLVGADPAGLASAAARALAQTWQDWARADAEAMPEARFRAALDRLGPDPLALAQDFGCSVLAAMRRIALRPGSPAGLVICDASGTSLFRKPVSGFVLPRFGAACALWPLFDALAHPLQPVETRLEMLGALGGRFTTRAFCQPRWPGGFSGPELREAAMLILPDPPGAPAPALQVGASCRICPRMDCPARREPSILG